MRGADISHQFGWPHGIPRLPYRFGRWFWRSQAMGRLDLPEAQRVHLLMQETQNAPERDRDIFQDVDFLRLVIRSIGQAFAQGYDYVWDDGVMSCSEFGFRVEEIRKDLVVQLWYGREDWSVPVNHGVQIAKRIGDKAQLRVEDETHSGIVVHWYVQPPSCEDVCETSALTLYARLEGRGRYSRRLRRAYEDVVLEVSPRNQHVGLFGGNQEGLGSGCLIVEGT